MGQPSVAGKLAMHEGFPQTGDAGPDITLFELRDALVEAEGVTVHHSSIAALLKRLGFTHKKSRWWARKATREGKAAT